MKRILGLTSIRSDYDLMSEVYRRLHADPEVAFGLLVSGAHLSPAFGNTVERIREDGFPIVCEIETLISADTPSARLKTAAGLLAGAIDVVRVWAPDVLVYAGDREDVLVAAAIGAFLGIPTAHFFGGDHACDGHVDNPVRHAASKLSTAHFVSLEEHRRRLLAMGEPRERVFVIGSVALDKFVAEPPMPRAELLDLLGAGVHAEAHPLAVLIFHPVEAERGVAADYVRAAVDELVASGYHVCIGSPNTDPGNAPLVRTIDQLGQRAEVTCYGNTTRNGFVNLMRHAAVMVGNSSAGLLEAATVGLPVINIGARQRGRLCATNVVFAEGGREPFRHALAEVQADAFRAGLTDLVNPYGDGRSAERAVELLKTVDFARLLAKSEDPLHEPG